MRSRIYCLAWFLGFILCLSIWLSHHRSILLIVQLTTGRDSWHWKRQKKLFAGQVRWMVLVPAYAPSQLRWFFLERGGSTEEWHWACRSFLVEHPQQHFYKLRKPCAVIFYLLSYVQLIQISEAGTQEHFCISNLAHSFDCKTYGESLQQPDLHHRVGFLSIPPLSLDNGLEQLKLSILFLNFCLEEALIFCFGQTKQKACRLACFPPKLAWSFSEKIQHMCRK